MTDETARGHGIQAKADDDPPSDDYDSAWKAVIDRFTEDFFALLFPAIHRGIDWRVAPESLESELLALAPSAQSPKGVVDRLIKLRRLSGEECWVLVHVEVQAQRDATFAERMFRYHYRIFDRYDQVPVSVAVLADESSTWRPADYEHGQWGCELKLAFPTIKLLDLDPGELEASDNPFAAVVMAHLKTQQTRRLPEQRARWKLHVARLLFRRWWDRDDILELYRFLDGLMALPEALEIQHRATVTRELKEQGMPHLTYWERQGLEKGKQEGLKQGEAKGKRDAVIQALEARFGAVPGVVVVAINAVDDLTRLDSLLRLAVVTESLTAFEALLPPSA